jgi:hypothetical protein
MLYCVTVKHPPIALRDSTKLGDATKCDLACTTARPGQRWYLLLPKQGFAKFSTRRQLHLQIMRTQSTNSLYPTLQDFLWPASIAIVKASDSFQTYGEFHRYMLEYLPQNSPETRRRYAGLVQRRFFPGRSLNDLVPTVWRSYHDEQLLTDVMRVTALEAEPVIVRFVLEHVLPQDSGSTLEPDIARAFIEEIYGEFKQRSYRRLLRTCLNLGFLGRYNGDLIVERIAPPADAFLILLHDRLAPTPRIVRLREMLETEWWRLLGIRDPEDVRRILRQAEIAGLLSRYTKVDELEQATTRYSREAYLGQAMRL